MRPQAEAGPASTVHRKAGIAILVGGVLLFVSLDVLVFALGSRTTGPAGPWAGLALRLVLDLAALAILRAPVLVTGLTIAGAAALQLSELVSPGLLVATPVLTGDPLTLSVTPLVVTTAVQAHNRRSTWVLIGILTLLATRPWDPSLLTISLGLLVTAFPALLGRYLVARRTLMANLRERAERTDREQHLLAEQARAEERRRLASEMHDVVTHRVSLMVLQAGALEVTARDDAARRAAAGLREAGMQALDELRDLVGVFGGQRSGQSPPVGPQAPRTDLGELVDASVAAGVAVQLHRTGDADTVPVAVLRTAHRVVQEALTNVHKHAPGGRVRVEVRYGADLVTVAVSNTAATADPVLVASGSGSGLRGLRERVEIIGGTLRAGALPDGGFAVRAEIPVVAS
ncbi:sensor histidine kinase [Pseudonocardia sp. MH-G8]|uniref:sensor histidine kinase n=1 Tax=Pseudonocardia sp. MH-G8 TaxID=1854588 RepID=UPI0018E92007|nr:sensor histidine kinase [Pseudonocardia sp. MH-G8]